MYVSENKTNTPLSIYPFGMGIKTRNFVEFKDFRFLFNSQEKDDEISGKGNSYSAEYWQYDSRLGRRWNLDPKPTVGISDYSAFSNNPIWFNDIKGDTLSWNLFNPWTTDVFNKIANTFIKRQTSDGIYAIFSHGTKWALLPSVAPRLGGPKSVVEYLEKTSKQFAKDMKAGKQITILLYSCEAAEGDHGLAEQISKEYKNITVVAADGNIYYENPKLPVIGKDVGYKTFKNGEVISKKILAIHPVTDKITEGQNILVDKSGESAGSYDDSPPSFK